MRIQPDAIFAGLPARQVRELLCQSGTFPSHYNVQEILGLNRKQSMRLLDRLEQEGYIEKDSNAPDSAAERYYKRTLKGGTLSKAFFSRNVMVLMITRKVFSGGANASEHVSKPFRHNGLDYSANKTPLSTMGFRGQKSQKTFLIFSSELSLDPVVG